MNDLFHDLPFVECYVDDPVVHSATVEDHILHLRQFFQRCSDAHLTLHGNKTFIGAPEIKFMGHIVGNDSVRMSPEKLDTIINWPVPENKKQLESFLGFCNYDARFVHKYATLVSKL